MNDSMLVGMLDSPSQRFDQRRRLTRRERPNAAGQAPLEKPCQAAERSEFGYIVGPVILPNEIVHVDDVWMPQLGRHRGFEPETLPRHPWVPALAVEHLYGYQAFQADLSGLVDKPHGATAYLRNDLV